MRIRSVFVAVFAFGSVACSTSSGSNGASPSDDGGTAGSSGAGPGSYAGASETGVATYYAATGAGNCSFDATPNDLDVAAMDAPEYDDSNVCGECVAIAGPKGNVTVRIVDQCPECEKGHLDLSQEAFAKIADVSAGKAPITWNVVECDVTGPLSYRYKDGSSQYWTAIQVLNSRLPIASLEIEQNGSFTSIDRADYNYFVDASGAGAQPVTVRVTSTDGQQITDTLPAPASDVTVAGASQFK